MPHCKRVMPTRSQIIADRTLRFLEAQSSSSRKFLTLDYDVLFRITQDLDIKTLKTLTHFPGPWRFEAQRRLLQVIDYDAHVCMPKGTFQCPNEPFQEWTPDAPYRQWPQRRPVFAPADAELSQCCTPERQDLLHHGLRPTLVRDIEALCALLKTDSQLCKHVEHAFISRDANSHIQVDRLIRQLQKSGSLQTLHLTGYFGPSFKFLCPNYPSMTSVHLDFSVPSVASTFTIRHLHKLLQCPTLTSAHISHFPFNHLPASAWTPFSTPSISPITTLTLTDGLPRGPALLTLLTWPTALTALHAEFADPVDLSYTGDDMEHFISALSLHASTLTTLRLLIPAGGCELAPLDPLIPPHTHRDIPIRTISLTHFRALTTLDLAFSLLINLPPLYADMEPELTASIFASQADLTTLLPLSLESLTLRLPPGFEWEEDVWAWTPAHRDSKVRELTVRSRSLLAWLRNLLVARERRFGALAEVRVLRVAAERLGSMPWLLGRMNYDAVKARWEGKGKGVRLELVMRDVAERLEWADVVAEPLEGG